MIAMVEAVPIGLYAPSPWRRQLSSLAHAASSSKPLRRESNGRHSAVPLLTGEPSNKAGTRNPLVTTSPGMSALAQGARGIGTEDRHSFGLFIKERHAHGSGRFTDLQAAGQVVSRLGQPSRAVPGDHVH